MRKRDIIALAIFGAVVFGRMGYKAYQQLQGPPIPAVSLEQARFDHPTQLIQSANHQTGPLPPIYRTDVLDYTSYEGPLGTMEAIGTPIADDGQLRPAVVWVTGGFGGLFYGIDRYSDPKNDQGIASFLERDIVVFLPALRGEHENPGVFECFFGEVDDIIAAVEHVANRPDVDPDRVYLMGHSIGGINVLLASILTDVPAGVVCFGGAPDMVNQMSGGLGYGVEPFDIHDSQEVLLRSPIHFTKDIKVPVLYIEGEDSYSYAADALRMERKAKKLGVDFHAAIVPGGDHFNVLRPSKDLLAESIQSGVHKLPSPAEIEEAIRVYYENPDIELFSYAYSGNTAQVRKAIENGANPNATDPRGATPMMIALQNRQSSRMISALLEAGADPNIVDHEQNAALFEAVARYEELTPTQLLLDAGARVDLIDSYGDTPLRLAAALSTNTQIIPALIEAGSDIHARNSSGYTALMAAATYNNDPEMFEILIANGAGVNDRTSNGFTPLIIAAANTSNPAIIEALLLAGADVSIQDINMKTALEYAVDNEALQDTKALKMLEVAKD